MNRLFVGYFVLLFSLFVFTACSDVPGEEKPLPLYSGLGLGICHESESEVKLCVRSYKADSVSAKDRIDLANRHCAKQGKQAKYVEGHIEETPGFFGDRWWEYLYRCEEDE